MTVFRIRKKSFFNYNLDDRSKRAGGSPVKVQNVKSKLNAPPATGKIVVGDFASKKGAKKDVHFDSSSQGKQRNNSSEEEKRTQFVFVVKELKGRAQKEDVIVLDVEDSDFETSNLLESKKLAHKNLPEVKKHQKSPILQSKSPIVCNKKVNSINLIRCIKCSFTTYNQKNLKLHLLQHAKIDKSKELLSESNVDLKLKIINSRKSSLVSSKVLKCSKCDYKTHLKKYLYKHGKIHLAKKYKCSQCVYRTSERYLLREHVMRHSSYRYKCPYCSVASHRKDYIKFHLRKKHGLDNVQIPEPKKMKVEHKLQKKTLKCSLCEFTTYLRKDLRIHEETHSDKTIKCSQCDYRTIKPKSLHLHSRCHSANRFKCPYCTYKTLRKDNLFAHVCKPKNISSKTKDINQITTAQQSDVKSKDNKAVSSGASTINRALKCPLCDYVTRSKKNLTRHRSIHSAGNLKCSQCSYTTNTKKNLQRHAKKHFDWNCPHCPFTSNNKFNLTIHLREHGPEKSIKGSADKDVKPLQKRRHIINLKRCPKCDFTTNNILLFWQHKAEHDKSFKCSLCCYASFLKRDLNRHIKVHSR